MPPQASHILIHSACSGPASPLTLSLTDLSTPSHPSPPGPPTNMLSSSYTTLLANLKHPKWLQPHRALHLFFLLLRCRSPEITPCFPFCSLHGPSQPERAPLPTLIPCLLCLLFLASPDISLIHMFIIFPLLVCLFTTFSPGPPTAPRT